MSPWKPAILHNYNGITGVIVTNCNNYWIYCKSTCNWTVGQEPCFMMIPLMHGVEKQLWNSTSNWKSNCICWLHYFRKSFQIVIIVIFTIFVLNDCENTAHEPLDSARTDRSATPSKQYNAALISHCAEMICRPAWFTVCGPGNNAWNILTAEIYSFNILISSKERWCMASWKHFGLLTAQNRSTFPVHFPL